ncbi:MAG: hypothetical protein LBV34_16330 [Nocardiopsaceae bacterium]|jgi:hypothetical protein|nr:hypothetical protein [Nocardiopsaceae bacterium]
MGEEDPERDQIPPHRRVDRIAGRFALAFAGLCLAGLVTWFWWQLSHTLDGPDNHVAATDSRVCRTTGWNNVPFDEVMRHFNLKLPSRAQDVVFTADVNPLFGEYSLDLRFTTTPAALRSFLASAGLPPASPDTRTSIEFGPASCGLIPPAGKDMAYTQDRDLGASPRAVAVDLSDRTHPTVWITALDM